MEISKLKGDETTERDDVERGLGAMETERGYLPLAAVEVEAAIVDLVAETTVRQTFQNPFDEPLEATYTFPLPPRAGVTSFRAAFGDHILKGMLKEREEAREAYDEAIEEGNRASIVEQERSDVFTMRVGNIAPGERATVTLTMSAPLEVIDGEATFRFPLVVAPRYTPGSHLDRPDSGTGVAPDTDTVPDASRVTPPAMLPNMPNPVDLSIEVHVEPSGFDMDNLRSTLHATVEEKRAGGHHLTVVPGETDDETICLNRDFILRFDVAGDEIISSARWTPDNEADDEMGTVGFTLIPPNLEEERRPRDIVFVLDRSGSMNGWKMVAARRAVGRMIESLTPSDRFHLLLFDNTYEHVSGLDADDLVEATHNRRHRTVQHLDDDVQAGGGTEMFEPLVEALEMLKPEGGYHDRRRSIVLVTDGQVSNEEHIVGEVRDRASNVAIQAVGIDQSVHSGFLKRLTEVTGGRCELVESESRLDKALDRIHRTIASPVVTELDVAWTGGDVVLEKMAPEPLPDLFEGVPTRIFARMSGDKHGEITVSGARPDGTTWRTQLSLRTSNSTAVETLWARRRIRALEDRYQARNGDAETLKEEIVETSLQHGVLSEFTAFVAVDESDGTVEGDRREITQPVEKPSGWVDTAPSTDATSRVAHRKVADAKLYSTSPDESEQGKDQSPSSGEDTDTRDRPDSYIPPEQRFGGEALPSGDVYAVAALMFELLTGEPLIPEDEASETIETTRRIRDHDTALAPLTDVLKRALAEAPATRFDDMQTFNTAIEEALDDSEGTVFAGQSPARESVAHWVDELEESSSTSLDVLMDTESSPPRAAVLSIIGQLGEILGSLHREGDTFDDFEPGRVFVDDEGNVQLE